MALRPRLSPGVPLSEYEVGHKCNLGFIFVNRALTEFPIPKQFLIGKCCAAHKGSSLKGAWVPVLTV